MAEHDRSNPGPEHRGIEIEDRVAVDRAICAARTQLDRWRRASWLDPSSAAHRNPWPAHRAIAGKTTYDALAKLDASAHEKPLIAAFRAQVMQLTIARVSFEVDLELARAANEPTGVVRLEAARQVSWRGAIEGILTAPSGHAGAYLAALALCAPRVASAAHARSERRQEAAKRLGEPDVDARFVPGARFARAGARALLDATEDLTADVVRRELSKSDGLHDRPRPEAVVGVALARAAASGWPSRMRARWLEELFGAHLHGLSLDIELPRFVAGASSFARALEAFGFAFGRSVARSSSFFSLADDPYASSAHATGALFGSLAHSGVFQRRGLGLGAPDAEKNRRSLAFSALFEARVRAARILLSSAAASRALFEEVTFRVFRSPLDADLLGAWPIAQDDELARFVAALRAPLLVRSFVERFDEDWFKNPRAFESLRHATFHVDAFESDADAEAAATENARQCARAFEGALA